MIFYRRPKSVTIYERLAYVRGGLLQEDESDLLQENSYRLLLEQAMPDLPITQTTLATTLDIQLDMVPVVDVSDTTNSPNGRTKHISVGDLAEAIGIISVFNYMTAAEQEDVRAGTALVDVTAAIQAVLTYAGANGLIVKGSGTALITGALTYAPTNGGGIDWDSTSSGGAGLKVSGTGYTALTVSAGTFSVFNLSVFGTGNTANGILFSNPQLSTIQNAVAYGLDGFGIKIDQAYDCLFGVVSSNLCGNATNYAVSVNDGSDTTNHSNFLRIQSEQANKRAVYISPNTVSCVFSAIHSERLTPDAAHTAWLLGGVDSTYNTIRLNSSGTSANAKCLLEGTYTSFSGFRAENNIPVEVEADGGTSLTLIEPTVSGTLAEFSGQTGKIRVYGGLITALSGSTPNILHYGTKIASTVQDAVTFTPVVQFGGGTTGITYTTQIGWARIIGDLCEGAINILLTNKGSSTGAATITGLPFTNKNTTGQYASVQVGLDVALTYTGHVVMYIPANSAIISISQINAGTETGLTDTAFANTTQLMLNFKYQIER